MLKLNYINVRIIHENISMLQVGDSNVIAPSCMYILIEYVFQYNKTRRMENRDLKLQGRRKSLNVIENCICIF